MNFQPQPGTTSAATATTTTTVTETHVQTNLRWDPGYVRTIPGILKVVQVVLNLIAFICVMASGAHWRSRSVGSWFCFVTMTAFWTTGTLLVLYLLHVIEKFHVIPWMLIEFVFCTLWTFFYFTASLDAAVNASYEPALGAACFFGFLAMAAYGYDAFLKFRGYRAGQLAQGERTVQQATVSGVQGPPAY